MSTFELGKLTRVELRNVWRHEANDFTPWLIDHIDLVGEVLGLELEVVGREQAVGDFAVDIVARDLGRNKIVVVENQLEETDQSHLGQLITYAAGLEAGVVIRSVATISSIECSFHRIREAILKSAVFRRVIFSGTFCDVPRLPPHSATKAAGAMTWCSNLTDTVPHIRPLVSG